MPKSLTGTYRVLVVDDDRAVRKLTVEALRRVCVECHTASDGLEAQQKLQLYRYDAVVTDMRMPRRHGHALCVELLSLPEPPLVFVLTGVNEPRLFEDLRARGVEEIFLKPVDFRQFARRILQSLERRRQAELEQARRAAALALDENELTALDRDVKPELLALLGLSDSLPEPVLLGSNQSSDPNWLL